MTCKHKETQYCVKLKYCKASKLVLFCKGHNFKGKQWRYQTKNKTKQKSTLEHRVSMEIRFVPVFKLEKIIKEKTAKIHISCCCKTWRKLRFLDKQLSLTAEKLDFSYWNYALYSRNFSFYLSLEYSSIPFFPFKFWGTFPTTSNGARSISESFPPPSLDIEAKTQRVH